MKLIVDTLTGITTTIEALNDNDRELVIVTTNENVATKSYLKNKIATGEKFNIKTNVIEIAKAECSELQIELIRTKLREITNQEKKGLVIQLPLSNLKTGDATNILDEFTTFIDVDGLRSASKQAVATGDLFHLPATALGVYALIKNYTKERKHIAILGQSDLVTKPLAKALIDDRHTVISMNSLSTKDIMLNADIVVLATGQLQSFNKRDVKKETLVIDVGIGRVDGRLCGEWKHKLSSDEHINLQITPVPNGVGRLTTHSLFLKLVML